MDVIIVDWNKEHLPKAVEKIKQVPTSRRVVGFDLDLSKIENVESLRDQVLKDFPQASSSFLIAPQFASLTAKIHVLMSNHAIINWAKSFSLTMSLRELQGMWAEIMGINFNSIIMVVQAFAPTMAQQPSESVIITSGSKLGVDNRP